ncbi:MAG: Crp/Fnr family transcriptional regulator [Sediminibacterium sp.]|nr:Crp/Fnr family transcriptional regulator [Sediminibacterium sp.]
MQTSSFKAFLQQFHALTPEEWEAGLKRFASLKLRKGECFVKQGTICRKAAFIVSGTLRTYYLNAKGEETTYCFCPAGSISTAYKSFILQQASAHSLVAIEDTELVVIEYTDLQDLYKQYAGWQTLGRLLTEQQYLVMEHYAAVLNNESATEKYLRLESEQPEVILKASVEDIASYLGITRRTLTRIRSAKK